MSSASLVQIVTLSNYSVNIHVRVVFQSFFIVTEEKENRNIVIHFTAKCCRAALEFSNVLDLTHKHIQHVRIHGCSSAALIAGTQSLNI